MFCDQSRKTRPRRLALLIDDTTSDDYWKPAISVYERYNGPYSPEVHQFVEIMMNKRIIVRIDPVRVRSWDHRKLGLPSMPLGGTTAEFLPNP